MISMTFWLGSLRWTSSRRSRYLLQRKIIQEMAGCAELCHTRKFLSQVFQVGFWCCKKQIWSTHRVDSEDDLKIEDKLKMKTNWKMKYKVKPLLHISRTIFLSSIWSWDTRPLTSEFQLSLQDCCHKCHTQHKTSNSFIIYCL